jgi:hypothetical protein
MNKKFHPLFILALVMAFFLTGTASARMRLMAPAAVLFASGLQGAQGSTIGPDGALYATEGATGAVSRIDPQSGARTVFASGLPPAVLPIGGAVDIAFIDNTAYVLVTLVSDPALFPTSYIVGIYRLDGPNSFTVIADLGAYSLANPPTTSYFISTGVQYSLEPFRGGLLVADGHHNRVLWVSLDGEITELITFGNIVPTGLEVRGNRIYLSQAGPVPHLPENGKVVMFTPDSSSATEFASGAPLAVDVEFGLGNKLYVLAQGHFTGMFGGEGSPADPNTGMLMEVVGDGTVSTIVDGLNQPTSLELVGNTAYVVTLGGEVWKIEDVSGPPFGIQR